MQRCKSIIRLSPLLLLVGLFLLPAEAEAQCSTSIVSSGTYPTGGMVAKYIQKSIGGSYMCTLTMSMSVIDCAPSGAGSGTTLSATAFTTAANPSCGWNCGCGTVAITVADGLPVELMEFSVEGSDDELSWVHPGESRPTDALHGKTEVSEAPTEAAGARRR